MISATRFWNRSHAEPRAWSIASMSLVMCYFSTERGSLPRMPGVKMGRWLWIVLAVGSMLIFAPASGAQAGADARAACPSGSEAMIRTELIFGMQRSGMPPVSRAAWQRFVARAISPRFPEGFTVIDAQGGWRGRRGLVREASRILIVWHNGLQQNRLEALRSTYKKRFNQKSVLRIDGMNCVSF